MALSATAQVPVNPQTIQGTVRFLNLDPLVLAVLGSGGQGMTNLSIFASGLPPAPALTSFATQPALRRTNSPYQITVESDPVGYSYQVAIRAGMADGTGIYWFNPRTSPPVTPTGGPVSVNVAECAGIVNVRFVNALGQPVAVSGGSVSAYHLPDSSPSSPQAQRTQIPPGSTNILLVVRGDQDSTIDTTLQFGASTATDRLQFRSRTNRLVLCDTMETVTVVVPTTGVLGRINGNVDVLREFELTVEGSDVLDYADYTGVIAENGPFHNKRFASVPGVNFTTPSSGPFSLNNLLPDSAEPGSDGHSVYAQAFFRTNHRFSLLRTPALGAGSNPPVVVTAGGTVNLGNTFVIDPGYIRGRIFLKGPDEIGPPSSLLRGVSRAADADPDGDGIPNGAGTYGVYHSRVSALGVNRRATGATYTAWNGTGVASFEGAFNPVSSAFEGDYELVVGGLNSERTLWNQKSLTLTLSGGQVNDGTYYYNDFSTSDDNSPDLEIVPGQGVTNDLAYCLSEVFIQFRSTSGLFHSPQVRFSYGNFSGTDFRGRAVNHTVYIDAMFGAPFDANAPTNIGYVRMLLPQGTYDLQAYVIPAGAQAGSLTEVKRFSLTVGCGQQIRIEQCLQLTLNAPACVSTPTPTLSGTVRSCTNVTRIAYRLNGGPEIDLCNNCGVNPSFTFTPTLPPTPCGSSTLTVTANDAGGASSFVTTSLRYDNAPPVITCPSNVVVDCTAGTNGVVVNFNATATDNCSDPVSVVCSPPSGSRFPVGTNTVTCTARDACGNTSQCSFHVTVHSTELTIERAVIVRWTCGTLQGADHANGPYTDIPGATSPYCVPSNQAKRFYRVRN